MRSDPQCHLGAYGLRPKPLITGWSRVITAHTPSTLYFPSNWSRVEVDWSRVETVNLTFLSTTQGLKIAHPNPSNVIASCSELFITSCVKVCERRCWRFVVILITGCWSRATDHGLITGIVAYAPLTVHFANLLITGDHGWRCWQLSPPVTLWVTLKNICCLIPLFHLFLLVSLFH